MAVSTKDSELATFSPNFCAIVSASAETYNMTSTECTALTALSTAYIAAYNAARVDGMKSKSLTSAKDAAKSALLTPLRAYYGQISALTTVSDTQKIDLGIVIRKAPSPTPSPSTEPVVTIVSVTGKTVRIRLRDAATPHRTAKPSGVFAATVMSYVGATPPSSISGWRMEGTVSKVVVDINFPDDTAPGAMVWFTCFWLNRKSQSGPASDPVNTYLQLGAVTMSA